MAFLKKIILLACLLFASPAAAQVVDQGQAGENAWAMKFLTAQTIYLVDSGGTPITTFTSAHPRTFFGVGLFDSLGNFITSAATGGGGNPLDVQVVVANVPVDPRRFVVCWICAPGQYGFIAGARQDLNDDGSFMLDGNQLVATQLVAQLDEVSPVTVTENNFGNLRMSTNHNLYDTIRDGLGNERGAAVDASNRLSVAVNTSILPTGAATEATLVNVLTTAAFQARINTFGQKTMATSTPVVLASDQAAIPVSQSGAWTTSISGSIDVSDRAVRLVGVVYGSQAQQLKQTSTNFNLAVESFVAGSAIDPRAIRALTSGDVVTVNNTAFGISQSGSNNDVDVLTNVVPAGLTAFVANQQAVTSSAVALPSNAGRMVCVRVLIAGTQNVFYGPSGVTTSTGQQLVPGEGMCRPLDNSNRIFVIAASSGSTVAFEVY